MDMIKELAERTPEPVSDYVPQPSQPICKECRNEYVENSGDICPRCEKELQQGYQSLTMTGRRANGFQMDAGKLYHAVGLMDTRAFCGAKPGKRSDWSDYHGDDITCPRCLKRIASIDRRVKVAAEMEAHRKKYQR
jgi:predicted amidophosphoribosyltransferase